MLYSSRKEVTSARPDFDDDGYEEQEAVTGSLQAAASKLAVRLHAEVLHKQYTRVTPFTNDLVGKLFNPTLPSEARFPPPHIQ